MHRVRCRFEHLHLQEADAYTPSLDIDDGMIDADCDDTCRRRCRLVSFAAEERRFRVRLRILR